MFKHVIRAISYMLILLGGLGAGYAAANLPGWLKPSYTEANNNAAYFPDAQTRVVLYGTSWCPHCADARAYFKSKNVKFADLDIEKNPAVAAQFKQLGGEATPLILIGNRRILGFNAEALGDALDTLNKPNGS